MKKVWISILLTLSLVTLAACGETESQPESPETDNSSASDVRDISVVSDSLQTEYLLDEFRLESLQLSVSYEDGSASETNVTTAMLSQADASKLESSGTHEITLTHEGQVTSFTIILKDRDDGEDDNDDPGNGETDGQDDTSSNSHYDSLTKAWSEASFPSDAITDFETLEELTNEQVKISGIVTYSDEDRLVLSDGKRSIMMEMGHMTNEYLEGDALVVNVETGSRYDLYQIAASDVHHIRRIDEGFTMDSVPKGTEALSSFDAYELTGKTIRVPVLLLEGEEGPLVYANLESVFGEYASNREVHIANLEDMSSSSLMKSYGNAVTEMNLMYVGQEIKTHSFIIPPYNPSIETSEDESLTVAFNRTREALEESHGEAYAGDTFSLPKEGLHGSTLTWDLEAATYIQSDEPIDDEVIDSDGVIDDTLETPVEFQVPLTIEWNGITKDYDFTITIETSLNDRIMAAAKVSMGDLNDMDHRVPVQVEGVVYYVIPSDETIKTAFMYDGTGYVSVTYENPQVGDTLRIHGLKGHGSETVTLYEPVVFESDTSFSYPDASQTVSIDYESIEALDPFYGEIIEFEGALSGLDDTDAYFSYLHTPDETWGLSVPIRNTDETWQDAFGHDVRFQTVYAGTYSYYDRDGALTKEGTSETVPVRDAEQYEDTTLYRHAFSKALPEHGTYGSTLEWTSTRPDVLDDAGTPVSELEDQVRVPYTLDVIHGDKSRTMTVDMVYTPIGATHTTDEGEKATFDWIEGVFYAWHSEGVYIHDGETYRFLDLGSHYVGRYDFDFEIGETLRFLGTNTHGLETFTGRAPYGYGENIMDESDTYHVAELKGVLEKSEASIDLPDSIALDAGSIDKEALVRGQPYTLTLSVDERYEYQSNGRYRRETDVGYIEYSTRDGVTVVDSETHDTTMTFKISSWANGYAYSSDLLGSEIELELIYHGESDSDVGTAYFGVTEEHELGSPGHPVKVLETLKEKEWRSFDGTLDLPKKIESGHALKWTSNVPDKLSDEGVLKLDDYLYERLSMTVGLEHGDNPVTRRITVDFFNPEAITPIEELDAQTFYSTVGTVYHSSEGRLIIHNDEAFLPVYSNQAEEFQIGDSVQAFGYGQDDFTEMRYIGAWAILPSSESYDVPIMTHGTLDFEAGRNLEIGSRFTLNDTFILKDFELSKTKPDTYIFTDTEEIRTIHITTNKDWETAAEVGKTLTIDDEVFLRKADGDTYDFILMD